MALGNAISVAVDKYNGILGHLGSQRRSRLRGKTREMNHNGADVCYYDIISSLNFKKKTGRRQRTVWEEANIFKKRGITANTGELPIVFDEDDETVLNYTLESPIFGEIIDAANRDYDDEIIFGLDADVSELDKSGGNTTPSTVQFDTVNQQISADIGASNSSLNHDKLRAIHKKFRQAEVSEHESGQPCLLVSAHELDAVADEIQTAVAFNGADAALNRVEQILQQGGGNYFGFDWIISERLGIIGDDRKCFAFYRSGVIFSKVYDVKVSMFIDHNESDAIKMRGKVRNGVVRLLDDRVIRVLCDADATFNAA